MKILCSAMGVSVRLRPAVQMIKGRGILIENLNNFFNKEFFPSSFIRETTSSGLSKNDLFVFPSFRLLVTSDKVDLFEGYGLTLIKTWTRFERLSDISIFISDIKSYLDGNSINKKFQFSQFYNEFCSL